MQNLSTRLDSSPSSRVESSHFPSRVITRSIPILSVNQVAAGCYTGEILVYRLDRGEGHELVSDLPEDGPQQPVAALKVICAA